MAVASCIIRRAWQDHLCLSRSVSRALTLQTRGVSVVPQQLWRLVAAQPTEGWCTAQSSSCRRYSSNAGTAGLCENLALNADRQFVFVGGKGGVGKTTTAAAVAVRLAYSGLKTLVVSTDPAHSLGDALGMDLAGGDPKQVTLSPSKTTTGSLYAMEIDPGKAIENFRRALHLDVLRQALREKRGGFGAGLMTALAQAGVDLDALAGLLELSPPGIDEVVALAQIMQLLESGSIHGDFQRIVIDTAPTGHTLRLLSFPQFLHGVIGTILALNEKVSKFSSFGGILGQIIGDDLHGQLQITKKNLESLMAAMGSLSSIFTDASKTSFVVVTIPTHLAVSESRRLLKALSQAQMPARHLIINQCPEFARSGNEETADVAIAYRAAQKLVAEEARVERGALGIRSSEAEALLRGAGLLLSQYKEARKQVEILASEAGADVNIYQVPVFDQELTGVNALDRYAGKLLPSTR